MILNFKSWALYGANSYVGTTGMTTTQVE